jgi:uncharacterized protein
MDPGLHVRRIGLVLGCLCWAALARAEVMPPAPARYFNDYAKVVPASLASRLNGELEQFEKDTSNQIVVAIFPKMESESSVEDYTVRVAQSWKVGQKKNDNGAVLFVFVSDRKMYIQVGYGLEGALPDVTCKRIIEDEIKPFFRQGDFGGGMQAGVAALMKASRGEYEGTGGTAADVPAEDTDATFIIFLVLAGIILWIFLSARSKGSEFNSSGRRRRNRPFFTSGGGGSGWGGGFGGGSGGGGGGGGFSGGGGGFGGGGAGGGW